MKESSEVCESASLNCETESSIIAVGNNPELLQCAVVNVGAGSSIIAVGNNLFRGKSIAAVGSSQPFDSETEA